MKANTSHRRFCSPCCKRWGRWREWHGPRCSCLGRAMRSTRRPGLGIGIQQKAEASSHVWLGPHQRATQGRKECRMRRRKHPWAWVTRLSIVLIAAVAVMSAAATASAAPSPILDFDLTQGYGTTVVDSANGVVGTTHGTLWSTDPSGMSVLYFDNPIRYWFGDCDYFEIPYHAALN